LPPVDTNLHKFGALRQFRPSLNPQLGIHYTVAEVGAKNVQ